MRLLSLGLTLGLWFPGSPTPAWAHLDPVAPVSPPRSPLSEARKLAKEHRFAEAQVTYESLAHSLVRPEPDLYFEWAQAAKAAGDPKGALLALEQGIDRLGEVPALCHEAVLLQVAQNDLASALARIDRLLLSPRVPKEPWLILKGSVEVQAGRRSAALTSYRKALTLLQMRNHKPQAIVDMLQKAQIALSQLGEKTLPTPRRQP